MKKRSIGILKVHSFCFPQRGKGSLNSKWRISESLFILKMFRRRLRQLFSLRESVVSSFKPRKILGFNRREIVRTFVKRKRNSLIFKFCNEKANQSIYIYEIYKKISASRLQLDLQDMHRLYACQVQQRASRITAARVLGRNAGINYRWDISRKLNEWRNNLQGKNIASSCYNCDIKDEIRKRDERDGGCARPVCKYTRRSLDYEIDRSLKFVSTTDYH